MTELPNESSYIPTDREAAALAMKRLVDAGNFVVLDTETTGLDFYNDVPCQVAVVAPDGNVLLDTLVKPHIPISLGAAQVHGITTAMVADAPVYADLHVSLFDLLAGKDVVIYNAGYDVAMLRNAAKVCGIRQDDVCFWHCAMEAYAAWHDDWNDYHGNYRWQKLDTACRRLNVEVESHPSHTALGDALRTLGVIKALAAWADAQIPAEVLAAYRTD